MLAFYFFISVGLKYSHIMFTAGTGMLTLATVGMYCYLVLGCLSSSVAISILHVVKLFLACKYMNGGKRGKERGRDIQIDRRTTERGTKI